jgi:hypothetical protein
LVISELNRNYFKDLFVGNIHNYGQHTYSYAEKGEKERGGNRTVTNKLLTMKEYKAHLTGKTGLGIIPINEESKCKFAVIDIDIYNQDFTPYLSAIERYNFPIVPFSSKSGGYHLYVFFKQFVKVKDAIKRLKSIARILGISLFVRQYKNEPLEFFPKQLKFEINKPGTWINLPYFNAEEESKQHVIHNGDALTLSEALVYIKTKLTTIEELDEVLNDLPFSDAPPCLQTLSILNHLGENSGRNNYLFSFAVYLKKKDENYFEQGVAELNNALPVPIKIERLEETVISSVRRKDYSYRCTVGPICDFCDKKVCQIREYGIGKEGGYFTNLIFGDMLQYQAASPYYEWQVKGQDVDIFKTLRFKNEDEIIKQDVFLKLCMRELHFLPFKMKQVEWFKLVNQALAEIKMITIDRADDTSPLIRFHNLFFDFLTTRAIAMTKDQINGKRVYFDPTTEKYYFKNKDLVEYLYDIKSFRLYSSGEIHGLLRDLGVNKKTIISETKKQIRVSEIMADKISIEYLQSKEGFTANFDAYQEEEQF